MTVQLLPAEFDELVSEAIQRFWMSRTSGPLAQEGGRGNVIGGKNLDGFLRVVRAVALHCDIPQDAIHVDGRRDLTLPGYYRPTKNWDVLLVHEGRLLAILEFKSQIGSFGNNFNNRTEEALGNATDLWRAARHGLYLSSNHVEGSSRILPPDAQRPFLGYLMLLEDCHGSTRPVDATAPHFRVLPEFRGASYAERYRMLCERMVDDGLYSAAALLLSPQDERGLEGQFRTLSSATSPRRFFAQLAGHLRASLEA